MGKNLKNIGLYVHVPFCVSKCPYCDFYSVKADDEAMDAYTAAVCACIDRFAQRYPYPADTLYFGGGTPILLGAARLATMIEHAQKGFGLQRAEITIEANPYSALRQTLAELHSAGANRLSMGLQSAVTQELAFLGRGHTPDGAKKAVEDARVAGFDNISLDIMMGIPRQTAQSVERSIDFCADLNVEHISSYLLKVEEGTPFYERNILDICPDSDEQAEIYLHAVEYLAGRGYKQYEISNFARDGKVSRHNLKYWNCEEYIGIGPSAHSFIGGERRFYGRDLQGFIRTAGEVGWQFDEQGGDFEEYAMLKLRLASGLSFHELSWLYPEADVAAMIERAKPMQRSGLLTVTEYGISLTPQGFLVSNAVIAKLIL
ncbi:radical SAM family heme chaperone HemW [Hydrogenoanaerobacterium sp.]|uniref:radical SAM family heme chaperone HemW n=1 Tax=Hydrogenoanaerobacterium sp. TaxID=2953763 RepID=UPI0028995BD2|nr:radical SAM family heme chaperone HemW [Hydrogenoanaerobacterium sp.]